MEAYCRITTVSAWCMEAAWALYHTTRVYFWVPSSCFCIVIQPLSEGEIIPFSGVCQSGEAALSTPEAVVASRTD